MFEAILCILALIIGLLAGAGAVVVCVGILGIALCVFFICFALCFAFAGDERKTLVAWITGNTTEATRDTVAANMSDTGETVPDSVYAAIKEEMDLCASGGQRAGETDAP